MRVVHCRVLLRNGRADSCDRVLCGWELRCVRVVVVFCVHRRNIPGFSWIWIVLIVHGRVLLRDYGPQRGDGDVRGGIILRAGRFCVLKLPVGPIFRRKLSLVRIMRCGDLSSEHRDIGLRVVHCRVLLRDHGPERGDGSLRCRVILSAGRIGVLKLPVGPIFRRKCRIVHIVHCGNLSSEHWG